MFNLRNLNLSFYFFFFFFLSLLWMMIPSYFSPLSYILVLLTLYLNIICILFIQFHIKFNQNLLINNILILFFCLGGLFFTQNLLIFYICFESSLIPIFLVIIGWGSRIEKVRAAYFLFFFTLILSLFMLLSILKIYLLLGTLNLDFLYNIHLPLIYQKWIYLALSLAFIVKIPLFPFHIWLPQAHVEAPLIGSILLAGIMLKLGIFGFLRLAIPICPAAHVYYSPFYILLSLCSVIYGGLTTFRQSDMKRLIAYSSVAHMGFASYALFNVKNINLSLIGCILVLIAHGFSSPGLFAIVGLLYERYHSRIMKYYSGCKIIHPIINEYAFLFTLASIAFPGSLNFIGELIIIILAVETSFFHSCIIGLGAFLGLIYSLHFYQKIFTGHINNYLYGAKPIIKQELIALNMLFWPLLFFGLVPFLILNFNYIY